MANSLSVGEHTLRLSLRRRASAHKPSATTVVVTVTKVDSTVTAPPASWTVGEAGPIVATVTPTGATGTVEVLDDGAAKLGERHRRQPTDGTTTATISVAAGALGVGRTT